MSGTDTLTRRIKSYARYLREAQRLLQETLQYLEGQGWGGKLEVRVSEDEPLERGIWYQDVEMYRVSPAYKSGQDWIEGVWADWLRHPPVHYISIDKL